MPPMEFATPLIETRLLRRYKRFLADVETAGGEALTVHCPNPGAMMGLNNPGARAWISDSGDPKRKLRCTLEILEADGTLVGINTGAPNRLAEEAIRAGAIAPLAGYDGLRREVRYGENSRIDLLLESPDRPPAYVEVKNVHLVRETGLAEFPDCVTARGAKHLRELAAMAQNGARAVQLFIVQRSDCAALKAAEDIDPAYAEGLRAAAAAGVEVIAYNCAVGVEAITVAQPLEVIL